MHLIVPDLALVLHAAEEVAHAIHALHPAHLGALREGRALADDRLAGHVPGIHELSPVKNKQRKEPKSVNVTSKQFMFFILYLLELVDCGLPRALRLESRHARGGGQARPRSGLARPSSLRARHHRAVIAADMRVLQL